MASAQPVADLDRVAVGAEPLVELRLYLEELFATVRPAELARFAAVPGTTLRTITVPLEHEATPERFRTTPQVALPVLELPDPRGSWAIILPLRYATFVPRGEKLEEVVAREAPRIVAARQASPWDYLTLLPAEEQRVESIRVPLRVPGADAPREDARRLLVRAEERRKAIELIETVALPWHEAMLAAPQPPVLSRDREARSL